MKLLRKYTALGALSAIIFASSASAQVTAEEMEAAIAAATGDSAFVFNTFLFLSQGLIVMFMAAGFAMLEAGFVRTKNVSTILLKNISLFSIAGIMYYLVGYGIMYPGDFNGFVSWSGFLYQPDGGADLATGYSKMSDWFFQMVFVATAASVVSGTVAERIKLWHFLGFVVLLSAIIYPITGSWQWGGGWLAESNFYDFAGSTLVHSVGGWAALVGAIIIGPRLGKYTDGTITPLPGSSMPLATLGTFILWFGWFGFNGGSQLALGSPGDANAIANIYANTFISAAAGCVAAMLVSQFMYGKVDLTLALNGVIGGLVSITAGPEYTNLLIPVLIGAIGGVLIPFSVRLLDTLKIDDVVGAIPAHLVCGIWGTLAVGIFYADFGIGTQLLGIISIGAFTVVATGIAWYVLNLFGGLRPSEEDEMAGLDKSELGIEAYPEFS
ncbi:MAG: ammonium transporter [Alphaproteobacteria bacterium]